MALNPMENHSKEPFNSDQLSKSNEIKLKSLNALQKSSKYLS